MPDCPLGPDCTTCPDFTCKENIMSTPAMGHRVMITKSWWSHNVGAVGTLIKIDSLNVDPQGGPQPLLVETEDGRRLMCSAVEPAGLSTQEAAPKTPSSPRYAALQQALRLFPGADDISAMGVADWLLAEPANRLEVSSEPVKGDAEEGREHQDDYVWTDSQEREVSVSAIGYEDAERDVVQFAVGSVLDFYLSIEQARNVISVLQSAVALGVDNPWQD